MPPRELLTFEYPCCFSSCSTAMERLPLAQIVTIGAALSAGSPWTGPAWKA